MQNLKVIDRIAVVAMFLTATSVPLASYACVDHGAGASPARQVQKEEAFRGISPGMSAAEVLAALGSPARKMRFEATKTTSWDYRYRDAWGYDAEFSVIMNDAGFVVARLSERIDP
ncbi:MAG TPA: hypothetical protein VHP55_03345 [Usitatibacter sp.]|jgi:outer membrane protein assembly factor BamE (lipoprotein component of BamABCDE complex)|nr:hypothetical protein [Usitatibacter sp.]